MNTLLPATASTAQRRAAELISRCVHCGFCNATCPTYQIQQDELDGPRGRIYLIREMLQQQTATAATRLHLDRCLSCRSCETTCPAGMQYGELLHLGREEVLRYVPRQWYARLYRRALIEFLLHPYWFAAALRISRLIKPLVRWFPPLYRRIPSARTLPIAALAPPQIKSELNRIADDFKKSPPTGRVLLFAGCVQPALQPAIGLASRYVLTKCQIEVLQLPALTCCGALAQHNEDSARALQQARHNLDNLRPYLDSIDAIVFDASGCGHMLHEYAQLLANDPEYAPIAQRASAMCIDLAAYLLGVPTALNYLQTALAEQKKALPTLAYHPPCTLQHGLKQKNTVPALLQRLGFDVRIPENSHLCCGSAGTYALFQPKLAGTLRTNKMAALKKTQAQTIVSANIGCLQHLQAGTDMTVQHWIEVLATILASDAKPAMRPFTKE